MPYNYMYYAGLFNNLVATRTVSKLEKAPVCMIESIKSVVPDATLSDYLHRYTAND